MIQKVLCFIFLIFLQLSWGQNKNSWKGYFSFSKINDITNSSSVLYSASENALFSKNILSNQIKTTNTIDGLSGETISSLYFSSKYNKTIIGYENGLMIVINEADGSIIKYVDIINKGLPSTVKRINHFVEFEDFLYLSCNFGIVQFNLKSLLFGDTYFIGDNGAEISVKQTAIFQGFIYAATNNGIRKADITSKNLIDFNLWTQVAGGNWSSVENFGTELVAANTNGTLHRYSGGNSFVGFLTLPDPTLDTRASGRYLLVSTTKSVFIFNPQLILIRQIDATQIPLVKPSFSCATSIEDVVYIGTNESGLFSTSIVAQIGFENTTPSGPVRNNVFSMDAKTTALWLVYGDYDANYNPYPLDDFGISKLNPTGWLHIPFEKVFGAKSMGKITVNPNNENEVYASSFFSGLLKIKADVPTLLYNQTNSGLESLVLNPPNPSYVDIRINGAAFDKLGNYWVTNSRTLKGLKVVSPTGQWNSYAMDKILSDATVNDFANMVIDKNGTKWMATNRNGVVGFNENGAKFKKISSGPDEGNLPISDVRTLAIDNRNQLWIGTTKGLRVLANVGSFQTDDQMKSNPIIILEDGLAQELLFEQFITDIEVDGANNKWIGTADSGLFLVSPNGQETKYRFTKDNSPLPSNTINDISINPTTGEVFIATDKGLISFNGVATGASDDLNNVFIYPNPVRPEFNGTVKIAGLLDKANVKITDIEGNLVHEAISEGGTIEWDTTAFGKYRVASGVYVIFISAQDGIETKVKKVMIIR